MYEADSLESMAIVLQRIAFQSEFYASKAIKILFLLAALAVKFGGSLIGVQYGNISREVRENQILTSGCYILAMKCSSGGGPT